ncbi:hypothetical protein OC834_006464 [Tilletia horrida]|uniref:DM2 domain-containing protein n=1 Tax=Tilletia horrida TaxID=155126 RepID=A0AAN6G453_9BASI|nr:hypothetical protein OC835_007344 [Tilletia horrida]KAK0520110.1 hypothetical protein OC842_007212 [Tilletia horrida]KAK0521959.1 hypothetical protein OC834_006464 [Tilletia horrida]
MADAPSSPAGGAASSSQSSLSEHEEILLRSAIRRILEAADLSSISAKNVREELINLQARQRQANGGAGSTAGGPNPIVPPSLDIMSHKKQVNALVKLCFEEVSAQKEQEAAAAAALAAVSAGGARGGAGQSWNNNGSRSTFAAGGIALPGIGAAPPASASLAVPSASSRQASSSSTKKRKREDATTPSAASASASASAAAVPSFASSPAASSSAATPNGYGDEDIEAELQELDDDTARTSKSKKARAAVSRGAKVKREPNPNNPFNRPLLLSAPLAEICGSTELSRPQVVKQLWAYIKGNDLQNPSNKRQILCDTKLQSLFGKAMVDSFEMAKLIGKHIKKKEDVL